MGVSPGNVVAAAERGRPRTALYHPCPGRSRPPDGLVVNLGAPGVSNYQVVTIATAVDLPILAGTQAVVVNCPSGTSVLSGFMYRVPSGMRHPFPPGVDWTGWPSGLAQWTFFLRNANSVRYTEPVEAGVVCATAN
jgi:hypothetical protein